MRIVFPEIANATIQGAMQSLRGYEGLSFVAASNLDAACEKIINQEADALVAGIELTSREVILGCRDKLGMVGETFSSSMIMEKNGQTIIVADAATCKNPSKNQLFDIVVQTYETAKEVLEDEPKIAMLSFSSFGSGTKEPTLEIIRETIERVKNERPEIIIDGEMQLDTAVDNDVAKKKAPHSQVAGRANVLICPDINSGNILYKSLERFGGFTAAGPILQGFKYPVADLSRGSTVEDVTATILVLQKIVKNKVGE